ncbi:unnamed protein product, partial [Heterosigma akashiwo]
FPHSHSLVDDLGVLRKMKLIQFFALASLCAPAVTLKSLRGDDQTFKSNYVDMVEETPSIRASSTSFRQATQRFLKVAEDTKLKAMNSDSDESEESEDSE